MRHCGYTITDIAHTGNYFNDKAVPQMIYHKCHKNSSGVDCLNNPIKSDENLWKSKT